MEQQLYVLKRNRYGLDEIWYPMTREMLLAETDFTGEDIDRIGEGGMEGAYFSNDTFTVEKAESMDDIMNMKGFDPYDSCACSVMEDPYPYYVDEKYRIGMVCYNLTGEVGTILPNSGNNNDLVSAYLKEHPDFGKDGDVVKADGLLLWNYTAEDDVKQRLSVLLHNNELTEKLYLDTLKRYGEPLPEKIVAMSIKAKFNRPVSDRDVFSTHFGFEDENFEEEKTIDFGSMDVHIDGNTATLHLSEAKENAVFAYDVKNGAWADFLIEGNNREGNMPLFPLEIVETIVYFKDATCERIDQEENKDVLDRINNVLLPMYDRFRHTSTEPVEGGDGNHCYEEEPERE